MHINCVPVDEFWQMSLIQTPTKQRMCYHHSRKVSHALFQAIPTFIPAREVTTSLFLFFVFHYRLDLSTLELHINGIIWYTLFSVWHV